MHNLVFFASGSGTNFQSVIDAINSGRINASITGLISDREDTGAIKRAKLHDIPVFVIEQEHPKFSEQLLDTLRQCKPDLIILAGYLKKIPDAVIREYRQQIINIHPSLLPKYGGKGYYGLKVHEAVLRNGETESGCTVHYVDEVYDNGAIIDQRTIHVDALDTPKSLAKKVLKQEHKLLPTVIKSILTKKSN